LYPPLLPACEVRIVKRQTFSAAAVVLSALLFVLAASLPSWTQTAPTKPLTIEAIYQPGGLTGRGPEFTEWSPDGTRLSFIQRDEKGEKGELWYVDAATGEKRVLVSAEKLASLAPDVNKVKNEREKERLTRYHVAAYVWAPDSKHIIFDSAGQLWLYDLATATAVQFTSAPEPSGDPKFSPDGSHVAYVRKHNLYVRTISGKSERQLTRDTGDNLFNGDIDWVYGEELFVRSNYFWSPNSKEIVFLHMDETKVPAYPITDWMPTHPTVDQEKYPKVGDPNPAVKLGVVDAGKGKVRWISLTSDEDRYIPRFGWVREGVIWATVLNRAQDKMDLYFVDAKSGKSRIVLTETTPGAWIDFEHVELRFLKSGGRILWPSWRDGNMHIYLYSYDQQNPLAAAAKLERQLTKGDFAVLGIEGVDEAAGTVFFAANKDDPREQRIFSVQLDGSGFKALTSEEGLHFADFSDDGKRYMWTYSGLHVSPGTYLCAVGGRCSEVWRARDVMAEYALRVPKYLEFKADDGTTLYGRLLLPPGEGIVETTVERSPADTHSASSGSEKGDVIVQVTDGEGRAPAASEIHRVRKIPLIVSIYGGPGAQEITKGPPSAFDEILARKGFAIVALDNRGSAGRDRKFQAASRRELGAIELKDQLTALDQLLAQYPQLDKDRVGIWGWSYGGFMTLYAMTHSDRFRAGVAVAPVTEWLNYDSIYTERYMGLFKDEKKAYEEFRVTASADKLHGALLLVHGTGDDNVHFQNSVQMVDALIKAGKQFRLMIYPNKTHSIAGQDARIHLFTMIAEHFERELKNQ
jgi:dipeptidyl-peptidase-4